MHRKKSYELHEIIEVPELHRQDGSKEPDALSGNIQNTNSKGVTPSVGPASSVRVDEQETLLQTDKPKPHTPADEDVVKVVEEGRVSPSWLSKVQRLHERIEHNWSAFLRRHSYRIWKVIYCVLILGFSVYLVAASLHDIIGAVPIIVLTSFVVVIVIYGQIKKLYGQPIRRVCLKPCQSLYNATWKYLKW